MVLKVIFKTKYRLAHGDKENKMEGSRESPLLRNAVAYASN